MAALVVGRHHLQARSREFLRRGLVLSGAIHLALLFAFLSLRGKDDVLVPTYDRVTEIFRQPEVSPLPPSVPRTPRTSSDATKGIYDPTKRIDEDFVLEKPTPGNPGPVVGPTKSGPQREGVPGSPNPPSPTENRVFLEREVDVPPVAIYAPKPEYPPYLRDIGETGRILAEVIVRPDGTVAHVKTKGGNRLFAESVEQTLYRWRFQPAMAHGQPVTVRVEIPVNFTL